MRIMLKMKLDKNVLPIEYRRSIISFIKKALKEYEEGRFYSQFYGECVSKSFSFGMRLGKATFKNDCILLEDRNVKLILSINNNKEGFIILNSLMGMRNKKFPLSDGNSWVLERVDLSNEVEIKSSSVVFKLLSPLCVREHDCQTNKDYYYSVRSDAFIEKLRAVVKAQVGEEMKSYVDTMQVVPIMNKKTVVKHYGQNIEATLGQIAISADALLLNYLYKGGIGSRKSSGFGLLDVGGV